MPAFYRTAKLNQTAFIHFVEHNLSSPALRALAKHCRFVLRSRRFDPAVFIAACIRACSDKEWTLSSLHRDYNRLMAASGRKGISWEPFHDFLVKPSFKVFIAKLTAIIRNFALRYYMLNSDRLVAVLRHKLDIDDILLQDGCEVTFKGDALRSQYKGKSGAAAKIHMTLSLSSLLPLHSIITAAVTSETAQVPVELVIRKLIIADAGYESQQLFKSIDERGGYYLMKISTSCMYKVLQQAAANPDGTTERAASPVDASGKPIGVSQVCNKDKRSRDIIAQTSTGCIVRVVRIWNDTEGYYVNFATNISPDILDIYQIAALYRSRWQIERKFRTYKGFCALQGSRSTYLHVQEALMLIAQMTADLKHLFAMLLETISGREISHEKMAHNGQIHIEELFKTLIKGASLKKFCKILIACAVDFYKTVTSVTNLKRGKCLDCVIETLSRDRFVNPVYVLWERLRTRTQ